MGNINSKCNVIVACIHAHVYRLLP